MTNICKSIVNKISDITEALKELRQRQIITTDPVEIEVIVPKDIRVDLSPGGDLEVKVFDPLEAKFRVKCRPGPGD